jgi:hypothetical protein
MHKARAFFIVCAGIFLLALTYHFGARSAGAQAGSDFAAYVVYGSTHYGVMASGDVYMKGAVGPVLPPGPPTYMGNFWGTATPAQSISIGQLKAKYVK